jgi:hypothetical protein
MRAAPAMGNLRVDKRKGRDHMEGKEERLKGGDMSEVGRRAVNG